MRPGRALVSLVFRVRGFTATVLYRQFRPWTEKQSIGPPCLYPHERCRVRLGAGLAR